MICLPPSSKRMVYQWMQSHLKLIIKTGRKYLQLSKTFQITIFGLPQGSPLAAIHFSIFLNDVFIFIAEAKLANFADNNSNYADIKDIQALLEIFERKNEMAIV